MQVWTGQQGQDQFAHDAFNRYRTLTASAGTVSKEARAAAATSPSTGHTDFEHLGLGESGYCYGVTAFIDLVSFTSRTFWDSPESVLRLNTAVMTQIALAVQDFGGYVLGFRGDGVFACFGDPRVQDHRISAGVAVTACAFALDATRNALNSLLKASGMRPVQVRAGADFGRLDFVRIGSEVASEVNVVGFSANFAAKCEKYAHSWEVVVGEELARLLPDDDLWRHDKSPKRYTRDDETKSYDFYQVKWGSYIQHIPGIREALAGRPVSAIRY
ncbi:adenylate/guanylate cyclase domain-containing protein [Streptomyces sp. NPDC055506]